jgi:hypothetical protein
MICSNLAKKEHFLMSFMVRILCAFAIGLIIFTAAFARKPGVQTGVTVSGIYENFTVGKGSGDLEGMRVVVVSAGDAYYAIVQIAQGGAEDPKPDFVPVTVKGRKIDFAVGDQKFTGTVSATGVTIKDASGSAQVLKRKACASYFKS